MAPSALEVEPSIYRNEPLDKDRNLDPVAFGGAEDKWLYLPESHRFDLSRGSKKKIVIDADDGIRFHRGCIIDPAKTVLLIVDMQNYFINPECCDHKGGLAAIPPTLKVIEKCRQDGIQVAWLNWGITDHDLKILPPAVQRGFSHDRIAERGFGWHTGLGSELPNGQGRCLWKGSWSAQLYDPLKEVYSEIDDLWFDKNRPSGMWRPEEPLHQYLRESGKKTILFAGVNTDQCVLGTLTDSYSWGFDCVFIADCAGTLTSSAAQEVCELNIARNYGFTTTSQEFLDAERV